MGSLRSGDHAFASGPVFAEPSGLFAAIRATGNWADGRLLLGIWRQLARAARLDAGVRVSLNARVINFDSPERVLIGAESVVRGILRNEAGGQISIGSRVYVGDNVILSAARELTVGEWTLLAHGVQVFDNDTHPVDPEGRELHFKRILGHQADGDFTIGSAPVHIGRRCWIGMNSLIFKGVTIGDGTVVAGGSVVTGDLPAGVIAAGNPARPLRSLVSADGSVRTSV